MSAPLVSVIMPCFNTERFVTQAVESALGQTHRELEVLVVDDGSTDRSAEIVRTMSASDARLSLLQKPHAGGSAARNFALDRARGKYVAFLDCDDFWTLDKIERHVRHLESDPAIGVSYSATQFVAADGQMLRHRRFPKTRNLSDFYLYCRNPITTGSCAVFRREIFDHHRFDETLRGYQDVDCWLRIAFAPPKSWRFEGIGEVLTYYRVHQQGISQDFTKHYAAAKTAWAKSYDYAPEIARKFARLSEAFQLRNYARRAIGAGNFKTARRTIFEAIRLDPRILYLEGLNTFATLAASFLRP
jgi:glycosyltransferase involved in cell wall biosynthesis